DRCDFEPAVAGLQFYRRRRADAFGGMSCLFEVERERHRKTSGFGCADEFFRICALAALESGQERVRPFECAAAEFHISPALFECALPYRRSSSCCHCFVSFSCFLVTQAIVPAIPADRIVCLTPLSADAEERNRFQKQ